MSDLNIRDAGPQDAAACAAIYAPYVTDTAVSFETAPPTPAQMLERMTEAAATHAWLVAERDDQVIGYAYGHVFAGRAAYRWACETSVYLDPAYRGGGAGRALYRQLLDRLSDRGFQTALAGMTLPNAASAGLHRAAGFEFVGTYRQVGYKHGRWHDVAWYQKSIGDRPDIPPEPGQALDR